jgi:hypothetical protein
MARLDRLGPAARDVAQTGAAIGREFGYGLLATTTDLPEPQLLDGLDRLTNASLLFVRGTPPDATYIFKHALVQDAAYGSLLRSRRQGAARSHYLDPRRPFPGDRAGATRAVGPALRGGRTGGKSGRLLAEGRSTGGDGLGDDGSSCTIAEGIGGADWSAGRPASPATGTRPANHTRIRIGCDGGLIGGECERDPLPSPRPGRTPRSTRIPFVRDSGPMSVSSCTSRA